GISSPEVVAFSPDGCTLAVIDAFGAVYRFDLAERRCTPLPGVEPANDVAFSPDGRLLALAGRLGSLRLYDYAGGRPLASFRWHTPDESGLNRGVNSVAFSPDGQWLATAPCDRFLQARP